MCSQTSQTHIENPIIELITLLTMSDTSFINGGLSLSRLEQSMLQFLFKWFFNSKQTLAPKSYVSCYQAPTHPTQFYCGVYWLISYKKRILMMKMQEEISCEIQRPSRHLYFIGLRSCKFSQYFPYSYINVSSSVYADMLHSVPCVTFLQASEFNGW